MKSSNENTVDVINFVICGHLGFDTVLSCRYLPGFQRNVLVLPPS